MSVFSVFRAISGISALACGLSLPALSYAEPAPTAPPLVANAALQGAGIGSGLSQKSAPAPTIELFSVPKDTKSIAGFRMGGAPQLDFVFGDIDIFKAQIDRFKSLHGQMTTARVAFSEASHTAQLVLDSVDERMKRRSCPDKAVAPSYAAASSAGVAFRNLGEELEVAYFAIRQLDELGESSGLTPDYRYQVKRSRVQYRQALTDLSEMRAVFQVQLESGLQVRGCQAQELLALAKANTRSPASKIANTDTAIAVKATAPTSEKVRASTATFFVDNRSCPDRLEVYVDGTLLGNVAPGTKAAFQSLMGRHSLCLLPENGTQRCGETGTLRNAFVYDAFSVSRHCEASAK